MKKKNYATGADNSPADIRTFAYQPDGAPQRGGKRYLGDDIEDQHRVGICTAISFTQNARKALGMKFSADFQYLLQKKYIDGNWNEGSSIFSALKVGKNYGLLPAKEWKFTKESDRKLPYHKYITKLQAVSQEDIDKLLKVASKYKLEAYAKIPVDRDAMAAAITESKSGILCRYAIGKSWWAKNLEPLMPSEPIISGHAVTDSNYVGNSFRIANTWGTDWGDVGTAYRLQQQYAPTEAWIPYYKKVPAYINKELENREKVLGRVKDMLQKIVDILQ